MLGWEQISEYFICLFYNLNVIPIFKCIVNAFLWLSVCIFIYDEIKLPPKSLLKHPF